ncbi:MAG: transcriptional repressor [Syntrophorhabdaceae bacterium]|nr:transcriptional repressor [Syntrophorhabdaceae bacterium]MDD4195955.1 transcriptional repressor [Syntrophorhabdaceae bacterium]
MERYAHFLKVLNLKATPKRLAVLDILSREKIYLSPEEVWTKLKERFSTVGLPTVYRNLEELADGGIIFKMIHPDRKLYYFFCDNKSHHHHFVCTGCRKVDDLNYCAFEEIEREVSENLNGTVSSHIIQVFGTCRQCSSLNKEGR